MAAESGWIEFWNRPNAIYVNQRNLDAHFECLKDDLLPHIPVGGMVVDYGCGDALAAEALAERAGTLMLYDAAPAVRERLRHRFAGHPRIRVLDDPDLAALPADTVDLVLVVSVLQYIPPADLPRLIGLWRSLLKPGGRLLIGDVVQPDTPLYRDVASQLRMAARHGFLLPAMVGIGRLALSDYRQLRQRAGFATYRPDQVITLLADGGLAPERLPDNIGPTAHRASFVGRKPQPAAEPAKVQ